MEHVDVAHCAYDQPNQLLFDYHVFSTLTLLPVAALLLYNTYLRRLYLPLARLVNAALLFRMISALLFFLYYPYHSGISNCPEIVLSKVTTMTEMFAELHQVYFIGVILGIKNFKACMSRHFSLSLVHILKIAFLLMAVAIGVSFFFFSGSLSFVEDLCTAFVSLCQIYVIKLATNARDDHLENSVVSVQDTSISVFKSLSFIQLFLSLCCVCFRMALSLAPALNERPNQMIKEAVDTDTSFVSSVRNAASVMLAVDFFCTYLFYIKVILVREKSKNVTVEILQKGYNNGSNN